MKTWTPSIVLASLCVLCAPGHAFSQKAPRPPRNPAAPAGQGTAGRTQLPKASGSSNLPAWLDDAATLDPGATAVELSAGRWSGTDGGETDGPVLDVAVGLTSRVQLNATVPYYRASYTDGYSASGRGDTYVSLKMQILDPGDHAVGVSIQPLLEVLSDASISDPTVGLSRVNWASPVTVQVGSDQTRTRAYASTGYSSRKAFFTGAAVEHDVFTSITLLGLVNFSHATYTAASTALAGLSRSRTDASGMIFVGVAPTVTLFGGLGRTISKLDQNGARLVASAGVRIETSRQRPKP